MAEPRGWVPIAQNIWWNPKVKKAAAELTNGDVDAMVGKLARLWAWSLDNAEDGRLSHLSPAELAKVMNYPSRSAQRLFSTLSAVGLVDVNGEIHDWMEWVGQLVEKRKRDRVRKRQERDRKRIAEESRLSSAGRPPDAATPSYPHQQPVSAGSHTDRPRDVQTHRDRDRDQTATETVPPSPRRTAELRSGTTAPAPRVPTAEEVRQQNEDRVFAIVAEADGIWQTALVSISQQLTASNFVSWFTGTRLAQRGDAYYVVAPNTYAAAWLRDKYMPTLRASIGVLVGDVQPDVRVALETELPAAEGAA